MRLAHMPTLSIHYFVLFIHLVKWISFYHKFMAGKKKGRLRFNGVLEAIHVVGFELGTQRWTVRIQSSNSPNSPTATGRSEYPPFDTKKPNTLQRMHLSGRTCAHGWPRAAALSTGTLRYLENQSGFRVTLALACPVPLFTL